MGTISHTRGSPSGAGARRRGPAVDALVGRAWELTTLRRSVRAASGGSGRTVLVDGPGGSGRSRLLQAAAELAGDADMRVLRAAGTELERGDPFGVALALLEDADWTDEALRGPAAPAAPLLRDGDRTAATAPAALGHALYWVVRNLADPAGVAVIVDDAQWVDPPSLRFLAHLADRAAEIPVAVIVAAGSGERCDDPEALAALRVAATGRVVQPAPLDADAVSELTRGRLPGATGAFCAACAEVTGGNPLLLTALLDDHARGRRLDAEPGASMPERVVAHVTARLRRLSEPARAVARAIAVLGPDATVVAAARLADGISTDAALAAADELAAVGLLTPGLPLTFAQPMLAPAVRAGLAPFTRAGLHLEAARLLAAQGADAPRIAAHLLDAPAEEDPAAAATLRAAAALEIAAGDDERGIRLLVRALAEHPGADVRLDVLTELGAAEARAGRPQASSRLAQARALATDPGRRAELALAEGQALYARHRYADAAEVLLGAVAALGDTRPELAAELAAAHIAAASLSGDLGPPARELRERLLAGAPTALQRAALAHVAARDALCGADRAAVRELADRAWGDGALLTGDRSLELASPLLCAALVCADELEQAIEIADVVLDAFADDESSAVPEIVSCARAWALYQQGRLPEAEADANAALGGPATRTGWPPARTGAGGWADIALAVIACCHIERGHLEQAESVLATLERPAARAGAEAVAEAVRLDVRAQLRLAQHRPQEALHDALQAGAAITAVVTDASPGVAAWRSTAALAQLALGETERARELADEELTRASAIGLPRIVARDRRIIGLALGAQGLTSLGKAAEGVDANAPRLEHVRALVDYGAALRRRNRRVDARMPLRRGLDLSHRGGAGELETRAQTELIAAGARPRRPAATGVDSLTVSQRRVAELAARGLTTRQIAEALFVTPKTVEFHLRQTYLKLDVGSREGLTEVLIAA